MLCRYAPTGTIALFMQSNHKMEQAWVLLKDHTKKISTIAAELGYSTPGHFSKAFKTYYRCTPSEVRKLLTCNEDFDEKIEWLSGKEVMRLKEEWEGIKLRMMNYE